MPGSAARRGARTKGWRGARWARRLVQTGALALFVALAVGAQLDPSAGHLTGVFFRFDPLTSLTAMLAAREWLPRLAPALATLALTLVLGRVWCGWICPLGTLLGWLRLPPARRLGPRLPSRLRGAKYAVLGAVAGAALLGSAALLILDPLALLLRALATAVLPGLDAAVFALERLAGGTRAGETVVLWLQDTAHGTVVPLFQPHYGQAAALLMLLLGVLLLNLLADRFWCRYLCPLGALLALLARAQLVRPAIGEGCTACGACTRACRLGAITPEGPPRRRDGGGPASNSSGPHGVRLATAECTMCLDCLVACPAAGGLELGLIRAPQPPAYDPGRREFLTAAALSAGAVLGAGGALLLGPAAPATARPRLIRPPGAQDEAAFLSRCLRCGACTLVCPTTGLQPALGQAGLEGFWTPVLTPRIGACDYACAACGRVCPSGAIPQLDLAQKQQQVLGVAEIDTGRCLPWADGTPCTVCEEMCPVPQKAIVLGDSRLFTWPDGTQDYASRPRVLPGRCIGCGVCENRCPVEGPAAIAVRRTAHGGGRGRDRTAATGGQGRT